MSEHQLVQSGPRATWTHISPRTSRWLMLHIVAVISIGLWLDIRFGWLGQHLATIWTIAVWAWLYRLGDRDERHILIIATVVSGIGEVFLSLIWGLYDYQFHNVPLFVPPGHALLMTLGLLVSRHIKPPAVMAITLLAAGWGAYVLAIDADRFGSLLFSMYAACIVFARTSASRALYATMFVQALVMELYGTALGNWFWHSPAPWVQLSAANPPFSAGAFYCVLDLLVLWILRAELLTKAVAKAQKAR